MALAARSWLRLHLFSGLLGALDPLLSGDIADRNLLDLPSVPVTVSGSVRMPILQP